MDRTVSGELLNPLQGRNSKTKLLRPILYQGVSEVPGLSP